MTGECSACVAFPTRFWVPGPSFFCLMLTSLRFRTRSFWWCLQSILQPSSSLDWDKCGVWGQGLPISIDKIPLNWAPKRHSSVISSVRVLINCTTWRVNCEDARVWQVNGSRNVVNFSSDRYYNWILRPTLRSWPCWWEWSRKTGRRLFSALLLLLRCRLWKGLRVLVPQSAAVFGLSVFSICCLTLSLWSLVGCGAWAFGRLHPNW